MIYRFIVNSIMLSYYDINISYIIGIYYVYSGSEISKMYFQRSPGPETRVKPINLIVASIVAS